MKNVVKSGLLKGVAVGIYLGAAFAFVIEMAGEITGYRPFSHSWLVHEIILIVTLIGFIVGASLIWQSNRTLARRNKKVEMALRAARGEFFAMIDSQFDDWGLSAAEKDVALLSVKGLSVAEIAKIRDKSEGTIKSQNNSIYKKAGVGSRSQLLVTLIDELLVEE